MTELTCPRRAVNESFVVGLDDVIAYHKVNVILGGIGSAINLILLFIFVASPSLRKKCENLIVLCLADGINTFSVMLMGLNRVHLYTEVVETHTIPVRTAWECALEPWRIFQGYGDLWPPTAHVAMGIEQCMAVFSPISYSKTLSTCRRRGLLIASLIPATCVLVVGCIIAWGNRQKEVKYWCGRKAAYGGSYASFIYVINIFGYVIAFILITASYIKSRYWMKTRAGKAHHAKIRCRLMISLLSVILVSIPNGISLFMQYVTKVADAISKSSTYLLCLNSSINIFVYFALYREFRLEFKRCILRRVRPVEESYTVNVI